MKSANCRRPLQAKLLRVLPRSGIRAEWAVSRTMKADVRILVAATNRDLAEAAKVRGFVRIFTTGSTSFRSSFRLCATGRHPLDRRILSSEDCAAGRHVLGISPEAPRQIAYSPGRGTCANWGM